MKRRSARIIDLILVLLILVFCTLVLNRAFGPFSSRKDPGSRSEPAAQNAASGGAGAVDSPASAGSADAPDVDSYNGRTLGTMPGSQFEAVTTERFPDSPLEYYSGVPELYAALSTKKIDGFVMSEVTMRQMSKQNPDAVWLPEVLNTRYRYLAFAKTEKGERLCAQMNELLAEYRADGTMDQMEEIWYGDDDSAKDLETSQESGGGEILHVGVSATDEPYNYIKDNELTGFNIDLVTRFAKKYGYQIEYTDMAPEGLLPGLTTGRFDMLATALSYTEERAQIVLFSEPVMQFDSVLAVRKEDTNLSGGSTGAAGTDSSQNFWQKISGSFERNFIREQRWKLILSGIGTTCLITVLAVLFGSLLAFGICMLCRSGSRVGDLLCRGYVRILQGTPMVVLLLILYYIVFFDASTDAVWVAVTGFSLHFGAYASQTLQSGIDSVSPGQREAALALGYTENQTFFHFVFPQAVRKILPVYRGEITTLLKGTAVAGYISVRDLTKMSDIIRSRTYESFFPLIATAVIYFALAWILSVLFDQIMKGLDPNGRKRRWH